MDSQERINIEMRKTLCEQLNDPELISFIQEQASYDDVKNMFFESKQRGAAYDQFFRSKLKEFGVESQEDLDPKRKKEFYNEIDAGWKAKNETD